MKRLLCLVGALLAGLTANDFPRWQQIGPWGGSARMIRLDRNHPDTLLAVSMRGTGVFRSRDAARNWTELLAFPRLPNARLDTALIVHTPASQWLVGAAPGGLWQSGDEGETRKQVPGTAHLSVFALAAWPGDERVIAAGTSEGVWMSNDGAATWRRISPKINADLSAVVSVAFDSKKAGTLFAGTPHLPWKTTNGGETWTRVATGMFDDSDIFSIAIDPAVPTRVYASACSGIYCSLNGGLAWRRVQGIPGTNRRTYVVAQDPHLPNRLFAGTSAGMWTSIDSGLAWRKLNDYVATSIAFHPKDADRFYISTERHGLLETVDGGQHFATRHQGFVSRTLLTVAGDKTSVYAVANYEGLAGGLYRRPTKGDWQVLGTGHIFDQFLGDVNGVLLAHSPEDGWLHSSDQGAHWTAGTGPTQEPSTAPPGNLFDGATSPFASTLRLAATSEGLFRSKDAGRSWTHVVHGVGDGWIRSVAFHPKRKGLCFALRHQRVFWSNDDGQHWYWLPSQEESHLLFKSIRILPAEPDLLIAVSEDRGLYLYDLTKNRVE